MRPSGPERSAPDRTGAQAAGGEEDTWCTARGGSGSSRNWRDGGADGHEIGLVGLAVGESPDQGPGLVVALHDDGVLDRALIVLRATQAALLRHAILLRWDPAALGADPAARLPGDLSLARARALGALGWTQDAAATALSLHLNHPPAWFGCWTCQDVAADGSVLAPREHRHDTATRTSTSSVEPDRTEPCTAAVRIPEHARALIGAHLAYRRIEGAGPGDPFFNANTPEELAEAERRILG